MISKLRETGWVQSGGELTECADNRMGYWVFYFRFILYGNCDGNGAVSRTTRRRIRTPTSS